MRDKPAHLVTRLLTPSRIKERCEMRRDAVNLETGKRFKKLTKNVRRQWVLIPWQALTYLRALPVEGTYVFMGDLRTALITGARQEHLDKTARRSQHE